MAIFLSALSGALVAVMLVLNALLGKAIGILESAFVVHAVGAVFGFFLMALLSRDNPFSKIRSTPKYLFLGGVVGVFIVLVANAVAPRLGVVLTVGLFLMGNMIFAVVADHFGFFSLPVFKITLKRLLGLVSAMVGLTLLL